MLEDVSPEAFPAQAGPAQDSAIRAFEQAEPAAFKTVLEVVYLTYYGDERVHRRIGWRTGPLQPRGFTLPPFDETILKRPANAHPSGVAHEGSPQAKPANGRTDPRDQGSLLPFGLSRCSSHAHSVSWQFEVYGAIL